MKYLKEYKLFENKLDILLDELDTFNLDKNDYAIFGSGPLAVRNLVDPHDLDVIIRPSKYKYDKSPIVIGNMEFSYTWPGVDNIEKLIDESEMIDGYPYVRIKYVEEYKNRMYRDKDIEHLDIVKRNKLNESIDFDWDEDWEEEDTDEYKYFIVKSEMKIGSIFKRGDFGSEYNYFVVSNYAEDEYEVHYKYGSSIRKKQYNEFITVDEVIGLLGGKLKVVYINSENQKGLSFDCSIYKISDEEMKYGVMRYLRDKSGRF